MTRWTDGVFYALAGLLLAVGYTAGLRASTALVERQRPALALSLHILRLGLLVAAMVFVGRYSRAGLFITMASFAVGQLLASHGLRRAEPPS